MLSFKKYILIFFPVIVDGLHLRSGLHFINELIELHGNIYLSHCKKCNHFRFHNKVIAHKTAFKRHSIAVEKCQEVYGDRHSVSTGDSDSISDHVCKSPLMDTIVHYGEPIWVYKFILLYPMQLNLTISFKLSLISIIISFGFSLLFSMQLKQLQRLLMQMFWYLWVQVVQFFQNIR